MFFKLCQDLVLLLLSAVVGAGSGMDGYRRSGFNCEYVCINCEL